MQNESRSNCCRTSDDSECNVNKEDDRRKISASDKPYLECKSCRTDRAENQSEIGNALFQR